MARWTWSASGRQMDAVNDRVSGLAFRDPADGELALLFVQSVAQKQFVTLPDEAKFDLPGQLTAELWVYLTAWPGSDVALISKGASAWQVRLTSSGSIQFKTAGLSQADLLSDTTIPLNEWHHIAVTWHSVPMEKIIYFDGLKDASVAGLTGVFGQNAFPVVIGAEPTSSAATPTTTAECSGILDEVRIWGAARSEERIRDNYSRYLNGTEPGLIGIWSFNGGSGSQALNTKSGSPSLHGTLSGMSAFSHVDGYAGLGLPLPPQAALAFNGTDEFIEIPHNAALNLPASATFEAWIKPSGTGLRTILFKGAGGYGLAVDENNYLRYFTDATHTAVSTTRVQNDAWQHVAVVIDGVAHTTTFYVNGKPAGSQNQGGVINNSDSLFLGKRGGISPAFFAGGMDDVRVWPIVRSGLEIELYAFQQLAFNASGLAAYWAFNDGSGTTVRDGTLSKINGTLQNMDGSNWASGQVWGVPALVSGAPLTVNPNSRGLWVGEVLLNKVNEVQTAINGVSETATPTAAAASMRVLLHVSSGGQVNLLKDVTVMETLTNPKDPSSTRAIVLVTDPRRLPEFQGAATRFGKRVGIRYGSVAYDFVGNSLPLLGGVGPGVGCIGSLNLPEDLATNPFKHRYHPDHRTGFAISRQITFEFDGSPGGALPAAPGYGVDRLTGVYKETILGLHKIPLKMEGTITLNRISQVDKLNNSN